MFLSVVFYLQRWNKYSDESAKSYSSKSTKASAVKKGSGAEVHNLPLNYNGEEVHQNVTVLE